MEASAESRPLEEPRAEHVGKDHLLAADDEEKHPVDGGNDEYQLGDDLVLRVDDVRDEAVLVDQGGDVGADAGDDDHPRNQDEHLRRLPSTFIELSKFIKLNTALKKVRKKRIVNSLSLKI